MTDCFSTRTVLSVKYKKLTPLGGRSQYKYEVRMEGFKARGGIPLPTLPGSCANLPQAPPTPPSRHPYVGQHYKMLKDYPHPDPDPTIDLDLYPIPTDPPDDECPVKEVPGVC